MPPTRLWTLRKPRLRKCSAACWLRPPWWQWKTSSASFGRRSSSAATSASRSRAAGVRASAAPSPLRRPLPGRPAEAVPPGPALERPRQLLGVDRLHGWGRIRILDREVVAVLGLHVVDADAFGALGGGPVDVEADTLDGRLDLAGLHRAQVRAIAEGRVDAQVEGLAAGPRDRVAQEAGRGAGAAGRRDPGAP